MIGSKKYPIKSTFKEAKPEKIQIFWNYKECYIRSISAKLLEEWKIHNMFNKDLLTQYRELWFKEQYMEMASLSDIINKKEEYKVEEV